MQITIKEIKSTREPRSWQGPKGTVYFHDSHVVADINGSLVECNVSIGSTKTATQTPPINEPIDVEEKQEYNGVRQFKFKKPFGGGSGNGYSGGRAMSPERESSIIRQCVFKGAIDLVVAGKIELKQIAGFVDKYEAVIKGGKPDAKPEAKQEAPPKQPDPQPEDDDDVPF